MNDEEEEQRRALAQAPASQVRRSGGAYPGSYGAIGRPLRTSATEDPGGVPVAKLQALGSVQTYATLQQEQGKQQLRPPLQPASPMPGAWTPDMEAGNIQTNDDAGLETTCSICLSDYVPSDEVRTLPCDHLFHKGCIDVWLAHHKTCPLCRGKY
jgi:hypothetical protein